MPKNTDTKQEEPLTPQIVSSNLLAKITAAKYKTHLKGAVELGEIALDPSDIDYLVDVLMGVLTPPKEGLPSGAFGPIEDFH